VLQAAAFGSRPLIPADYPGDAVMLRLNVDFRLFAHREKTNCLLVS